MTKKKFLSLLLAIAMLAVLIVGCSSPSAPAPSADPAPEAPQGGEATPAPETPEAPAEKPTVTLWTTGSQNLSDLFTLAIEEYNALPDAKCTVELQFLMSGTGDTFLYDRLAAAFKSGQTDAGFDIVAENSTYLPNYVAVAGSEDLFLPVDHSKIPNMENVLVTPAYDATRSVPYRITTVVFAYDSERVPNPPKTWAELTQWIKDNPGRFAYNPPNTGGAGGGFVSTAVYKDLPEEAKTSADEKWKEEWTAGLAWMEEIHPYLYKSGGSIVYPNKNQGTLDLLVNKEVDIIPAWADQVMSNIDAGTLPATTMIYQLDQPLNGTDVVFTFPSMGSHQEEAYDFVNFMLSPRGQQLCLETIFAIPVIDSATIDSPAKAALEVLDVSKISIIAPAGGMQKALYDLWDETMPYWK